MEEQVAVVFTTAFCLVLVEVPLWWWRWRIWRWFGRTYNNSIAAVAETVMHSTCRWRRRCWFGRIWCIRNGGAEVLALTVSSLKVDKVAVVVVLRY
jgi:hypothetical protein